MYKKGVTTTLSTKQRRDRDVCNGKVEMVESNKLLFEDVRRILRLKGKARRCALCDGWLMELHLLK
jgi:hypothetical protein